MENKITGTIKHENKVGLTTATLPQWARILIAQHIASHILHHCSNCGCAIILTAEAYQFAPVLCPECSMKKSSSKSQGEN